MLLRGFFNPNRVTDGGREVILLRCVTALQCYSSELTSSPSSDGVRVLEFGLVFFFRNRRLSLSAGLGLGCL